MKAMFDVLKIQTKLEKAASTVTEPKAKQAMLEAAEELGKVVADTAGLWGEFSVAFHSLEKGERK